MLCCVKVGNRREVASKVAAVIAAVVELEDTLVRELSCHQQQSSSQNSINFKIQKLLSKNSSPERTNDRTVRTFVFYSTWWSFKLTVLVAYRRNL